MAHTSKRMRSRILAQCNELTNYDLRPEAPSSTRLAETNQHASEFHCCAASAYGATITAVDTDIEKKRLPSESGAHLLTLKTRALSLVLAITVVVNDHHPFSPESSQAQVWRSIATRNDH